MKLRKILLQSINFTGRLAFIIFTIVWQPLNVVFAQSSNMWSEKAAMPTARKELVDAVGVLNGEIYVLGGRASGNVISNAFEVFNPNVTQQWRTLTPYPLRVWRTMTETVNGMVYVFGGYQSIAAFPFVPTNKVFAYDPIGQEWIPKADMPVAMGSGVAVALEGKIHVLGGTTNNAMNTHFVYDPAMDRWTTSTAMQESRSGLAAVVSGGKIYAIGGYILSGGVQSQSSVERYDPVLNRWEYVADMPIPRHGITASALGNKIYVMGGAINGNVTSRTLEYNPETNAWKQMPTTPAPVSFAGAASLGDSLIYLIGGGEVSLTPDGINRTFCFAPNISTSISEQAILKEFLVFPNPASEAIQFKYTLPQSAFVEASIMDMNGRMITTLFKGNQAEGNYEFKWESTIKGGYFFNLVVNKQPISMYFIFQ